MAEETADETKDLFLLPCSICSRTFKPESLARHEKVCEKTQIKKRKVFDSAKSRAVGTDLEQFLGPAPLPGQPKRPTPAKSQAKPKTEDKPKVPKWRQTHEALVATLRIARGEPVSSSTVAPPITAVTDCEQCPTCGRNFGPRAYDRHVEFCKEMEYRKARGPQKDNPAHDRQQKRLQYRAPPPNSRSRHEIVISSISSTNLTPTQPSIKRAVATAPLQRAPPVNTRRLPPATAPLRAPRSPPAAAPLRAPRSPSVGRRSSEGPGKCAGFVRQGSTRGSLRLRGVSPAKAPLTRKSSTMEKELPTKLEKTRNSTSEAHSDNNDALNRTFIKKSMAEISAAAALQMNYLEAWSSDNDLSGLAMPLHSRNDETTRQNSLSSPKTAYPRSLSPSKIDQDLSGVVKLHQSQDTETNRRKSLAMPLNSRNDETTRQNSRSSSKTAYPRTTPPSKTHNDLSGVAKSLESQNTTRLKSRSSPKTDERSTPSSKTSSDNDLSGLAKLSFNEETARLKSLPSPKVVHPRLTPSPKTSFPRVISSPKRASPLHASPTSAFSPVSSKNNNFSLDDNSNWSDHSSEEFNPLTSTPKPVRNDNRRDSSYDLDPDLVWAHLEAQMRPIRSRKKTFARSTSVFDDRNRMLYLQTFVPVVTSSEEDVSNTVDGFRPREKTMTMERKITYNVPRPESDGAEMVLAGGDSAYSSLNRRTPPSQAPQRKLSSFCHGCGGQYPVATAKFCCQCGIQRLFIVPTPSC